MTLRADEISRATREAYQSALKWFARWLAGAELGTGEASRRLESTSPRPARVVLEYITEMANMVDENGRWHYSEPTIRQALAAINWDHACQGVQPPGSDPAIRETMRRIKDERSDSPSTKPLRLAELQAILVGINQGPDASSLKAARDRCLILFTFAGSFLVQETVAMKIEDVGWGDDGDMSVRVKASSVKTLRGERTTIVRKGSNVLTCAACAFTRWMWVRSERSDPAASPSGGHVCDLRRYRVDAGEPLFLGINSTGLIHSSAMNRGTLSSVLKKRAVDVGIDPHGLTATSLRLGFVAEAMRAEVPMADVARHSGHHGTSNLLRFARRVEGAAKPVAISVGL